MSRLMTLTPNEMPTPVLCDLATPPSTPIRVRSSVAESAIAPRSGYRRRIDPRLGGVVHQSHRDRTGDPKAAAAGAGLGEGEVEDRSPGGDDQAG